MSEWWLIGLLILITFVASFLIVFPLRRQPLLAFLLIPVIFVAVSVAYYYWGGFAQWQQFVHSKNSEMLAQKMLKTIKSPQVLIDKMEAKLETDPSDPKGWYLLGRIYISQNENQNATNAFAKAYHLKPADEQIAVNYAHSLWLENQQQFSPKIRDIFNNLLKNNPNQPDALAMLAMDAFMSHAYEDAIEYWQRLLRIAPQGTEEAEAIRKAIVKAQEQINLRSASNDR